MNFNEFESYFKEQDKTKKLFYAVKDNKKKIVETKSCTYNELKTIFIRNNFEFESMSNKFPIFTLK